MELKALPTVMIFQNQKGIGKVEGMVQQFWWMKFQKYQIWTNTGLRTPVVKEALTKIA